MTEVVSLGPCERHSFAYLGLQWWNDGQQRPGSSFSTVRYVNVFFCTHCLFKRFERADLTHASLRKPEEQATPISRQDWEAVKNAS